VVGRYVVKELIAAGGMGVIYLAQDPQLNRAITLKLLREDRRGGPSAQAQLLREAQAMAQLSHPNVVAVYDVGTYGTQVFVAMEFVDGETLTQWMRRCPRRCWNEVRGIFVDAGRALAAAHAVGIVHRDFKPGNVLLGADGRARVTDFGLARPLDTDVSHDSTLHSSSDFGDWDLAMTLTETGAIKGTPAYMAPEQFAGDMVDERTDQFSFCVALYEALHGRRPFRATSAELTRRAADDPISLSADERRVPAPVREALRRGLSADPTQRFPSMQRLLEALSDASGEAVGARRRRRWLTTAIAVGSGVALIAAAGLVLHASGVLGSRTPAPRVSARPAPAGEPRESRPEAASKPAPSGVSSTTPAAADGAPPPRRRRRKRRPTVRERPGAARRGAKAPKNRPRQHYDDDLLVPSFAKEQ